MAPSRLPSCDALGEGIFRVAVATESVGHGASGLLTKAACIPYFGVFAIPGAWVWRLMPAVGTLAKAGVATLGGWLERIDLRPTAARRRTAASVLRWAIALSLVGHGGIALSTPERWMVHLAALGTRPATPGGLAALTGTAWLEIALGAAIVAPRDRTRGLLVLVCSWKIATEALRIPADEAIWESIERGGAYAAPVLVALLERADTTDPGASSRRETIAREQAHA
jgi:hypothetical protein